MIKLENAMIWWNDNSEARRHSGKPRIVALSIQNENMKYHYLSNSAGSCDGGWISIGPDGQARRLLAIYAWATGRNGVSSEEAHKAFMEIEEYREWLEYETGPFAKAYID